MRRGVVLLLMAVAVRAGPLETALANVHRRHAERLLGLAAEAEDDGQLETARALRVRVLELDANHLRARLELGWSRGRDGRWERDGAPPAATDADPVRAAGFARRAYELERKWMRDQVRVCNRYATPEQRTAVLSVLLQRFPDDEQLRTALGHVRVHGSWVRPSLVPLVEAMPAVLERWRSYATRPVTVEPAALPAPPPGVAVPLHAFRAGPRIVASTLDAETARALAEDVLRTRLLLDDLLGADGAAWDPPVVLFLAPKPYADLLAALHPDEETRALYARYDNYEHAEWTAIRSAGRPAAAERYAHGAAHLTAWERAAPDAPAGREGRDADAYPWLREGLGYLVAFELLDRGYLDFVSIHESSAKRPYTRPVPAKRTLAECRAWVREQIAAGHAHPLREVCGMRLNALDFCASMQAWSFVRFLLLTDAEAFRALLPALREGGGGSDLQRTDRALQRCFGRGLDALAPRWRAFALEVDL